MEKDKSDLHKMVKCPSCGMNYYAMWIWHGIQILQCKKCLETYPESELLDE